MKPKVHTKRTYELRGLLNGEMHLYYEYANNGDGDLEFYAVDDANKSLKFCAGITEIEELRDSLSEIIAQVRSSFEEGDDESQDEEDVHQKRLPEWDRTTSVGGYGAGKSQMMTLLEDLVCETIGDTQNIYYRASATPVGTTFTIEGVSRSIRGAWVEVLRALRSRGFDHEADWLQENMPA